MERVLAIAIRLAATTDIPAIQDLASRIWREHYPGIITHAQIDYMLGKMYSSAVMRDEIERQGYTYLLALHQGTPAGFAAWVLDRNTLTVKLSKLYLLPELHGRGIGRKMLQYVKDEAQRAAAKRVSLFVNKRNTKAIRAYERFGFVKAEEVVTDIGGGFVMDDFRMELAVSPGGKTPY